MYSSMLGCLHGCSRECLRIDAALFQIESDPTVFSERGLKFGQGKTYAVEADIWKFWDFKHKPPGSPFPLPILTNTGIDLAHALSFNPNLRVLVLNGYFDLATPFFASESMMAQLHLDEAIRQHVEMKYYPAGHMVYLNVDALARFKADLAAFYDRAQ